MNRLKGYFQVIKIVRTDFCKKGHFPLTNVALPERLQWSDYQKSKGNIMILVYYMLMIYIYFLIFWGVFIVWGVFIAASSSLVASKIKSQKRLKNAFLFFIVIPRTLSTSKTQIIMSIFAKPVLTVLTMSKRKKWLSIFSSQKWLSKTMISNIWWLPS